MLILIQGKTLYAIRCTIISVWMKGFFSSHYGLAKMEFSRSTAL